MRPATAPIVAGTSSGDTPDEMAALAMAAGKLVATFDVKTAETIARPTNRGSHSQIVLKTDRGLSLLEAPADLMQVKSAEQMPIRSAGTAN